MDNEQISYIKTLTLSSRDQAMTHFEGKPSKLTLTRRDPISIIDLNKGYAPARPDIKEGREIYERLAEMLIHVFSVGRGSGEEFIAVGPRLTAEETNALLYFSAIVKVYGFDTADIINDWTALYEDPIHQERKARHAKMPGWSQYEASRELILGILRRNYQGQNSGRFIQVDPKDSIIPVIHWRKDNGGKRALALNSLDDELRAGISEQLPDHVTDPSRLDVGMGVMFLSTFSPDQTRWPEMSGYGNSSTGSKNDIGPSQVLAFAFRRIAERQAEPDLIPDDQDVQQSPILASLDEYIETGERPVMASSVQAAVPNSSPRSPAESSLFSKFPIIMKLQPPLQINEIKTPTNIYIYEPLDTKTFSASEEDLYIKKKPFSKLSEKINILQEAMKIIDFSSKKGIIFDSKQHNFPTQKT